jgi:hypothetical protein
MQGVIEQDALQAFNRKAAVHQSSSAAASEPVWATSTTFWQDIASVGTSNGSTSSSMLRGSKTSAPAAADSDKPLADAQGEHRGYGRTLLIEELDSSKAADQQYADHTKEGGVVIEELGHEEGDARPGKPCNSCSELLLTPHFITLSLLCDRL